MSLFLTLPARGHAGSADFGGCALFLELKGHLCHDPRMVAVGVVSGGGCLPTDFPGVGMEKRCGGPGGAGLTPWQEATLVVVGVGEWVSADSGVTWACPGGRWTGAKGRDTFVLRARSGALR